MANKIFDSDTEQDDLYKQPLRDMGQNDSPLRQDVDSGLEQLEKHANQSSGSNQKEGSSASQLEDLYNQPARQAIERNTAKPRGFYHPTQEASSRLRVKERFRKKKKSIIGGVVGVIVAAGIFGGATFLQGPFQFIHFAQLLQSFHFPEVFETDTSFTQRAFRYMKYGEGEQQNRRLGIVMNQYANRIETKMADRGVDFNYDGGNRGKLTSITVDPAGSAADEFRQRGFDIPRSGNPVEIEVPNGRRGKRVVRAAIRAGDGSNAAFSAINSRIMIQRSGLSFKWLGEIQDRYSDWRQRSRSEKRDAWEEDRETKTKEGQYLSTRQASGENEVDTNEDGTADAPTDETQDIVEDINEGIEGSGDQSGTNRVNNIKGKVAGGVGIIGGICLVRGLANNVDLQNYENVWLPTMRIGGKVLSMGSQLQSGEDVDAQELGFEDELHYVEEDRAQASGDTNFNNPESAYSNEVGSWASAKSVRAELGEQGGKELPPDMVPARKGSNAVSRFFNQIPGVAPLCEVAEGPLGIIVDVVDGGAITAIIENTVGDAILGNLVGMASRALSNDPIPFDVAGPQLGNVANYGVFLETNEMLMARGGEPRGPDNQDRIELKSYSETQEYLAFKSKPLSERLFDVYDNRSLVAKLMNDVDYNFTPANVTKTYIAKGMPSNIISSIFNSERVVADNHKLPYDYNGLPRFGYSLEELNQIADSNPFANEAGIFKNYSDGQLYNRMHKWADDISENCFRVSIAQNGEISTLKSVHYDKRKKDCENKKNDVKEQRQDRIDELEGKERTAKENQELAWLYANTHEEIYQNVRRYIGTLNVVESMACFEGLESACSNVGF